MEELEELQVSQVGRLQIAACISFSSRHQVRLLAVLEAQVAVASRLTHLSLHQPQVAAEVEETAQPPALAGLAPLCCAQK